MKDTPTHWREYHTVLSAPETVHIVGLTDEQITLWKTAFADLLLPHPDATLAALSPYIPEQDKDKPQAFLDQIKDDPEGFIRRKMIENARNED